MQLFPAVKQCEHVRCGTEAISRCFECAMELCRKCMLIDLEHTRGIYCSKCLGAAAMRVYFGKPPRPKSSR